MPGIKTVAVGQKAEKDFGKHFIWVLAGIPKSNSDSDFEYYIIPSSAMAKNVSKAHQMWLGDEGKNGRVRLDSSFRTIHLPPNASYSGWRIDEYKNRWDLIEELLNEK